MRKVGKKKNWMTIKNLMVVMSNQTTSLWENLKKLMDCSLSLEKNWIFVDFFPGFENVEYFKIFTLFIFILVISLLLFGIAYFLSLSTIKDSEKLSQYECGFEPFDEATRHPFDVHFYVVGILFLIFDIEIALLFPWVLGLKTSGWLSFFSMVLFLLILTIGFFYEWHRGALVWTNEQILYKKIREWLEDTDMNDKNKIYSALIIAPKIWMKNDR